MREIPELQVLCLRAVGSHACSAEDTFARLKGGNEPSRASRLLRKFHQHPVLHEKEILASKGQENENDKTPGKPRSKSKLKDDNCVEDEVYKALQQVPIARKPCIGTGSSRRANANEVDLNHPIIGCQMPVPSEDEDDPPKNILVMQYGSPALDCLQSYIDSLVEIGRMDDSRLGIHFFEEWKANVQLASGEPDIQEDSASAPLAKPIPKKRKRSRTPPPTPIPVVKSFGSLSLYNCTMSTETIEAMVKSGMCPHLAVLDLTGVHGVTDDMSALLFTNTTCMNLRRLSLKNCRKISGKTLRLLPSACGNTLECLDIGGCFNMSASEDVLQVVPSLPVLSELHASGLQWNDNLLETLVQRSPETLTPKRKNSAQSISLSPWRRLSLGFSYSLTQTALRESLMQIAESLQSLSLPFCETVVDNALMGIFGRNLPLVKYLDLRGNAALNTITGWYDGRASADLPPAQELVILGRYTSLSEGSVEETRRVHPLAADTLRVILDGGGMGAGIDREYR